ncbi:hypothetical protein MP638_004648 [Amoeboaphelidium occidentale]|nr:hypothetical protein MP638_004648 [Amoeboaphelidium occidentale]
MSNEFISDELEALKAIYDDMFQYSNHANSTIYASGVIDVVPHLVQDYINVRLADKEESLKLFALCPVQIYFTLPSEYPSLGHAPQLRLQCIWLSSRQLSQLKERLDLLAADTVSSGNVVLFDLAEYVKDHVLSFTDFADNLLKLDIEGLMAKDGKPTDEDSLNTLLLLRSHLLLFSRRKARMLLDAQEVDCSICIEKKSGRVCYEFSPCGHVFCFDCLLTYFKMLIDEGTIFEVACANTSCGKKSKSDQSKGGLKHMAVEDLAEIFKIGLERVQDDVLANGTKFTKDTFDGLFDRYQILLEKNLLDQRSDVLYCPRMTCGRPCFIPQSDEQADKETNRILILCENCGMAFCSNCRKAWHNTSNRCQITDGDLVKLNANGVHKTIDFKRLQNIVESYRSSTDDTSKFMLEQEVGGRKQLRALIEKFDEEMETRKWLTSNTKACPTCGTRADKTGGCNHMQCSVCYEHWCWLCGSWISGSNPYHHFNSEQGQCYQKLFENAVFDDQELVVDEEDLVNFIE